MTRDTVASSAYGHRQIRFARENVEPSRTSATSRGRAINSGRRSIIPLNVARAIVEAAVGRVDDRPAMTLSARPSDFTSQP